MNSVFISHNWRDKPTARKIAETLQPFGIRVWLDEAEIKIGDSLIEKIRTGIDNVDYVIALLSSDSVASEWVKKELDIAMNQEIEGRKVKVLPVLCGDCSLPGFLKGKLYADMSSPKAFRKSLPMLLDRLGVDPALLTKMENNKGIDKVLEETQHATDVAAKLCSDDTNLQYQTLKSLKDYKYRKILRFPQVLDALENLSRSEISTHIRLESLRSISLLEDTNFADRIESLVLDPNPTIVSRAIQTLIKLKSSHSSSVILDQLRITENIHIQNACWDYFSEVLLDDEPDVVSLVWLVENCCNQKQGDPGVELRAIKVLLKQWNDNRDYVLEPLLKYWDSQHTSTRLELLLGIKDAAGKEDLWTRRPELKSRLKCILCECLQKQNGSEVALACLAGLLWYEFDRKVVWSSLLNADSTVIEVLIQEFEEYRLDLVFDEEQDVTEISKLIEKYDGEIREDLFNILVEIGTVNSLRVLATYNYTPKGWGPRHILKAIIKLPVWDASLEELLDLALENIGNANEAQAFALLSRFKANRINLDALIDTFPPSFKGYVSYRSELTQAIHRIRPQANAKQKRRLTRFISALKEKE